MPKCAFCQTEIAASDHIGRGESCPSCHRDLHSCFQCRFYDETAHHECREPQADFVSDKEKANFCDYFVFNPQKQVKVADKEAQKAKLDALFKKK